MLLVIARVSATHDASNFRPIKFDLGSQHFIQFSKLDEMLRSQVKFNGPEVRIGVLFNLDTIFL